MFCSLYLSSLARKSIRFTPSGLWNTHSLQVRTHISLHHAHSSFISSTQQRPSHIRTYTSLPTISRQRIPFTSYGAVTIPRRLVKPSHRQFSTEYGQEKPKVVSTLHANTPAKDPDAPRYVHRPAWLDQVEPKPNTSKTKGPKSKAYIPRDARVLTKASDNAMEALKTDKTSEGPQKKTLKQKIFRPLVLVPLGILFSLIGGAVFAYKKFTETVLQKEAKQFAKLKPDTAYRAKLSPQIKINNEQCSLNEQRANINTYYRTIQKDLPVVEEKFLGTIDKFNEVFDAYGKVFKEFETIPMDFILGDDNLLTFDETLLQIYSRLPLIYEELQSKHHSLSQLIETLGILDQAEESIVDPIESLEMTERDVLKLSTDFSKGYTDIYDVLDFLDNVHHMIEKYRRQLNTMADYIDTRVRNPTKSRFQFQQSKLPPRLY